MGAFLQSSPQRGVPLPTFVDLTVTLAVSNVIAMIERRSGHFPAIPTLVTLVVVSIGLWAGGIAILRALYRALIR
jgi:hypothetical protein